MRKVVFCIKTEHAHLRAIESLELHRFPEWRETYECVCERAYWIHGAEAREQRQRQRKKQADIGKLESPLPDICYSHHLLYAHCSHLSPFFFSGPRPHCTERFINRYMPTSSVHPWGVAFVSFASELARMYTYLSRANGISASTHTTAMLCTQHLVLICRMLKSVDMCAWRGIFGVSISKFLDFALFF